MQPCTKFLGGLLCNFEGPNFSGSTDIDPVLGPSVWFRTHFGLYSHGFFFFFFFAFFLKNESMELFAFLRQKTVY